jgi:hypothetical protein
MNDDLYVVGDRVRLAGILAHWLDGELRADPNYQDYQQGQRGTVVRTGKDARNVCVAWDAPEDVEDDEEWISEEWVSACCLAGITYSTGLRDGIPEPYTAMALRQLPGSHLAADIEALLNANTRADAQDARERLRAAVASRRLFTVTLPAVAPPPREDTDA